MDKKFRSMVISITLIAGLLITGCSKLGTERSTCDTQFPVRSGAGGSYQYQSSPEVFSYEVTGEMSTTRLHLVFEQNEGSVSWKYSDPVGVVQWEGEYGQAGSFDETRDFTPVPGEWKLEINGENGNGTYDHCWMARSQ